MYRETNTTPQNAKVIKTLGILSFFIPCLSIVTLIISRGYNKRNNYGNSTDISMGKLCAKISLIGRLLFALLVIAATFVFLLSSKEAGIVPEILTEPIIL